MLNQNNPSEKIKLLETPKAYSTKQSLREGCGQEKRLGYSDNEYDDVRLLCLIEMGNEHPSFIKYF